MAESFKNRVDALTGFGSTEDDALSDWLADGSREIINILPPELLQYCSGATRLDDSPSSLAISTDTDMGKILHVTHSNGTRQIPCRLIPAAYSGYANDFTSLTYFGTDSDPVYWITGTQNSSDTTSAASILEVFPTPTSSKTAFVHHITYPGVLHSWTSIDNFPDNAEYLVVLYAAQKALQRLMNNKNASLSALSVTAVPPDVPTLSTTTVSFSPTLNSGNSVPTYTSPTIGSATEFLTAPMTAITSGQVGTDADFIDFSKWFTALGEMIEDDEDIELASAQIEKINAYVQSYNIAMQDALNTFNEDMAEYQVELQISVQNAQLADSADNKKLTKFQAELAEYQAEVSAQVQEYTQNLQKDTLDYGWYAKQYAYLKADYMLGISMLKTGNLPQAGGQSS